MEVARSDPNGMEIVRDSAKIGVGAAVMSKDRVSHSFDVADAESPVPSSSRGRGSGSPCAGDRLAAERSKPPGGSMERSPQPAGGGWGALPLEYMVGICRVLSQGWLTGFEPAISRSTIWCLNR